MNPLTIFRPWNEIHNNLIKLLDRFTNSELSYQPFIGGWPVGRIFLHIAETEDFWIHAVVRQELSPDILYTLHDYPSHQSIRSKLILSHEKTQTFIAGLKEPDLERRFKTPDNESLQLYDILWHVIEHEVHHRGELSLALGLLGREGLEV